MKKQFLLGFTLLMSVLFLTSFDSVGKESKEKVKIESVVNKEVSEYATFYISEYVAVKGRAEFRKAEKFVFMQEAPPNSENCNPRASSCGPVTLVAMVPPGQPWAITWYSCATCIMGGLPVQCCQKED
jgi:hypothetical protein